MTRWKRRLDRSGAEEVADRAVPGDLILVSAAALLEARSSADAVHDAVAPAAHDRSWHGSWHKQWSGARRSWGEAVCEAITRTITTLPEQLRRSLTWERGAEMAQHARLKIEAGLQVYFCDPQSPWQRATNENTNGLLRQYFPRGTDLSVHSADEIAAVAIALNTRPCKTLEWRTPAETLDELLRSTNKLPVAMAAIRLETLINESSPGADVGEVGKP
jgi:transposase, IS30 family